jgi:hypothetical protein
LEDEEGVGDPEVSLGDGNKGDGGGCWWVDEEEEVVDDELSLFCVLEAGRPWSGDMVNTAVESKSGFSGESKI